MLYNNKYSNSSDFEFIVFNCAGVDIFLKDAGIGWRVIGYNNIWWVGLPCPINNEVM